MAVEGGYSARVVLTLVVGGVSLSLSHVGPGELIVRETCAPVDPCDAELVIQVGETTKTQHVFLPNGIHGPAQAVKFF